MKKILVRAPNWIGDQILAYPFFYYLRRAYPQARIASVCVSWVADLQYQDLVDEVIVLPKSFEKGLWGKLQHLNEQGRMLRSRGPWDLAITLPNSLSTAWLIYRAGAAARRGYLTEGRSLLLNAGERWDPSPLRHRAQAYADLLPAEARPKRRAVEFWGVPPENELDPRTPGEAERFEWEKSWAGFEQLKAPQEPYWVLAPGATADSRRWPIERVAELARRIADSTSLRGIVVGGPSEAVIAMDLCKDRSLRLTDWTARCPVPGLAELFSRSRFTVTNESGLAHVASLCGAFVQIICGAADPRRTRPIGPGKVQVAVNPVECWPCEKNTCFQPPERRVQCLKGIDSDTVLGEINRGLGHAQT